MLQGVLWAGLATLLIGGYLVAYKRYFADLPALLYLGVVETAALCWYALVGALVLPGSLIALPADFSVPALALLVAVAGASLGAAVTSVRALQTGDVSYVTPLTRLSPPVALVVEVAVVGQRVTAPQVLGLCVVTAGVYLVDYEAGDLLAPFVRVGRSRPARLALVSAGFVGTAAVGRRVLLAEFALPPRTLVLAVLVGLAGGTLPLGLRRWAARPRSWRTWLGLVAAGLVLALGDHLSALAFDVAPASVVVPVLSGQVVVAVVLGGELLDEQALGRRTAAAVAVAVGVTLVALG